MMKNKKAWSYLKEWLKEQGSRFEAKDLKVSETHVGFLECKKPCYCVEDPFSALMRGIYGPGGNKHFHTVNVSGVKGSKDRGFTGRGKYAFWRALGEK